MKKKIVLFHEESYHIDDSLNTVLRFLQSVRDKTPEEFRDNIEIESTCDVYYDSASLDLEIFYWREETQEEENKRLAYETEREAARRKKDIERLKELRKLYPDD